MVNPDDLVADVWEQVRPSAAQKVSSLRAALEVLRAGGDRDDLDGLAAANAHRLAGSLGTYGFTPAAEASAEIERILAGDGPVDLVAFEAAVTTMERAVRTR